MKRRLEELSHQPRDIAIKFVSSWSPIRNQNTNLVSGDGLELDLYQPHRAAKPSQKINKYTKKKNRSQAGDTSRAPGKTKIKPLSGSFQQLRQYRIPTGKETTKGNGQPYREKFTMSTSFQKQLTGEMASQELLIIEHSERL